MLRSKAISHAGSRPSRTGQQAMASSDVPPSVWMIRRSMPILSLPGLGRRMSGGTAFHRFRFLGSNDQALAGESPPRPYYRKSGFGAEILRKAPSVQQFWVG